jgi:hypothetical protein
MACPIHLGPNDILNDHAFTHPSHTFADLYILRYMIDQLCVAVENHDDTKHPTRPVFIYWSEPDNRPHRLVIIRPERLKQVRQLTVVGFFGHKKDGVSFARLDHMDELLLQELTSHPGLLSYCTLRLYNENSGNLVLFENTGAQDAWADSKNHGQAVRLAPNHYTYVRIYNGFLTHGLKVSNMLQLSQVKYFNYESDPLWRAVRTI